MRLEPLPANKNTRTGRVQVQSDRQSFGKIVHEESRSRKCCVTVGCTFPVRLCMLKAVGRPVGIPALQGWPAFTVMTVVSDLHRTSPSSDVLHRNLTACDSVVNALIAVWISGRQSGQSGAFCAVQCAFGGFFQRVHRPGPVSDPRPPKPAATVQGMP